MKKLIAVLLAITVLLSAVAAVWFHMRPTPPHPPALLPGADPETLSLEDGPGIKVQATGRTNVKLPSGVDSPTPQQKAAATNNVRQAAIDNAKQQAVQTAAASELALLRQTPELALAVPILEMKVPQYVPSFEVQEETDGPDQVTVSGQALVATETIAAEVESLKALLKRRGRPNVLLVVRPDADIAPGLLQRARQALEQSGVLLVSSALSPEQKAALQSADSLGPSQNAAVAVARQLHADLLMVISLDVNTQPRRVNPAIPLQVTPRYTLLRTDSSGLLAAGGGVTQNFAVQDLAAALNQAATTLDPLLRAAVRPISAYWLEDVYRGGAEKELVLHEFSHERSMRLTDTLQRVRGVRQLLLDSTATELTLRVQTNASMTDLLSVVQKLDPATTVISSTTMLADLQ